jgi:hypothetical protein
MTRQDKIKVANNMSAEELMNKLVKYGGMLERDNSEEVEEALYETIDIIKAEITNRIMGL